MHKPNVFALGLMLCLVQKENWACLQRRHGSTWVMVVGQGNVPQVTGMPGSNQDGLSIQVVQRETVCRKRGCTSFVSKGRDAEQIVHQVIVSKYVGNHGDSANFEHASSNSGEEGTICSPQKGKRGRTRLGHLDVGEDRSIALAEKDVGCTSVDDEVIQG
jgi:hypothetical protein